MLHETCTKCSKDGAYLLHVAESLPQSCRHGLCLPLGSRSLNSPALSTSWPAKNGELDHGVWNKQRQGYFPAALFRRSCIGSAERCLHLSAQFPGHLAFPSGSGERAWLREFPWVFSPRPACGLFPTLCLSRATLGQAACSWSWVRFHIWGAAQKKAGFCSVTFLFLARETGHGRVWGTWEISMVRS